MADVRGAPAEEGVVRLIVRRPGIDSRELLEQGELHPERGLVGDDWVNRGPHDEPAARYSQLTLMNARFTALIAGGDDRERWAEAGDQLYVDFDISEGNLPAGTRLSVGTATIEISAEPHTGCAKFSARFGSDAWKLANSPAGRSLRLRGLNARVVEPGMVRTGDAIRRA